MSIIAPVYIDRWSRRHHIRLAPYLRFIVVDVSRKQWRIQPASILETLRGAGRGQVCRRNREAKSVVVEGVFSNARRLPMMVAGDVRSVFAASRTLRVAANNSLGSEGSHRIDARGPPCG